MELNLYNFYNKGYSVSSLTPELLAQFWRIIHSTEWYDDPGAPGEQVPTWVKLDNMEKYTDIPLEQMSIKKHLFNAPQEIKEFGQALLYSGYFDPFLAELVGSRYMEYRWINNVEIISFLLRQNTMNLGWHTDFNSAEDFFVLVYVKDGSGIGGDIKFGLQDEHGEITVLGEESPQDGKIICVNCVNPYFKHMVTQNEGYTRYVLNIKFRINKL